jgi:hypothetical protein
VIPTWKWEGEEGDCRDPYSLGTPYPRVGVAGWLFFTHRTVENDIENVCKKFESISSKTYDTESAACPF